MEPLSPVDSKWCPSCGDEYEPRIFECVDCRVPLVPFRPRKLEPVAVSEPDSSVDGGRAFDLGDLTDEERAVIALHLDEGEPIPHQWLDEQTIMALPGYIDELEQVVDRVRRGDEPGGSVHVPELAGELVSLRLRTVAALVDVALATACGVAVSTVAGAPVGVAVAYAVAVANHVFGFGTPGRSVGKRALGSTIRRRAGQRLSLGESFVRWLIRDSLGVVVALVWWASTDSDLLLVVVISAVACRLALIGTIVVDVHHRGLHDLAIDSAVYRGSIGNTDDYLAHVEIIS